MWIFFVLLCLFLAVTVTIFFAISPRRRRNTAPFNHTLYAHRGLHNNDGTCPENSLAAFKAAKEAGYGVELDVRFTADQYVVVFHDDTLLRMCGNPNRVDECTYKQLQELRLLNTDERIPLLSEVLDVLDDTSILCEIKPMRSYLDTSLCEKANQILTSHNASYCIESFNPYSVRWFRKNAPDVIRGVLSKRYNKGEIKPDILRHLLTALMTNFLCRPDFIAYQHTDYRQPFFRLCKAFRPTTFAWTIRSLEEQRKAARLFDSFIFEGYKPPVNGDKSFSKKV